MLKIHTNLQHVVERLFYTFVVLASIISCLVFVAPAAGAQEPLRWNKVNIPAAGEAGGWVLAGGSDITHLAAAGDGTLYVSVRGLSTSLYKSVNGGYSWTGIGNISGAVIDIAVSPRDANKVYYATQTAVFRSTNGGRSFSALPVSGGAGTGHKEITCLDVTSLGNSIIAIGVRDTDSAKFGGVYTLDETSAIPVWNDTGIGGYDVYSLAFSPNYSFDRQLVAVITDETDTYVACKFGEGGWNPVAERAKLNRDNSRPAVSVNSAGTATIAFPHNYNGDPSAGRNIFYIGINPGGNLGDVYKVESSDSSSGFVATDLNAGKTYGFNNVDVGSLAAAGDFPAVVLISGEAGSTRTYSSADGGRTWTRTRKEPSGAANTCMLAALDFSATGSVYAATAGANSALSVSRDSGATWNQISFIDTAVESIIDLAPSPRYTKDNTMFMLTFGSGHSLWRSKNGGETWERTLACRPGSVDEMKLVGLPPNYGNSCASVFVAGISNGKPSVWQSSDDGQTYRCQTTRDPITGLPFNIDTWAMLDENSFFTAGFDGNISYIYLTTTGGFIYSEGTPAGNYPINSLAVSPFFKQDGTILAGNNCGWVYISPDNNGSYHPLPVGATSPPFTGSVAVAYDPRYDDNHAVFASSDTPGGGIHRLVVPGGQEWSNLDSTLPSGATINHLAFSGDGALYAANSAAEGGMERSLSPASGSTRSFESVTKYLPQGAKLTGLWQCDHNLWTIDSANTRLLTFHDTLTAPTGQVTPVNQAAGLGVLSDHSVKNVVLDWSAMEGATSYQWQCDYSAEFASAPAPLEGTTTATSVRLPALEPATTYYWRVRASAPVVSPWSEKKTFSTSPDTEAIVLKTESPSAGAGQVPVKPTFQWTAMAGASAYELLVATNIDFARPAVVRTGSNAIPTNAWQCDVNLDFLTTYYWKIRTVNQNTTGDWSATGIFTTELAPLDPKSAPVMLLKSADDQKTAPASSPPLLTAPMPVITTPPVAPLPGVKATPVPTSDSSALPVINQSVSLPAWTIYLMFGLLGIVFLALFIVLVIVLKIKRF